jgi:hypothetical protein
VLGLINDTMNDKRIAISDIEITSKFSFFDVESSDVRRMLNAFTMHAEAGIILTEVLNNRKPGRRDKFERNDRRGEHRGGSSGGFRGKNSESGKEWRTRKNDDNNKSKKKDSEYYKKKKDGFKRNR